MTTSFTGRGAAATRCCGGEETALTVSERRPVIRQDGFSMLPLPETAVSLTMMMTEVWWPHALLRAPSANTFEQPDIDQQFIGCHAVCSKHCMAPGVAGYFSAKTPVKRAEVCKLADLDISAGTSPPPSPPAPPFRKVPRNTLPSLHDDICFQECRCDSR